MNETSLIRQIETFNECSLCVTDDSVKNLRVSNLYDCRSGYNAGSKIWKTLQTVTVKHYRYCKHSNVYNIPIKRYVTCNDLRFDVS